jgi:hypothetical protein
LSTLTSDVDRSRNPRYPGTQRCPCTRILECSNDPRVHSPFKPREK